MCSNLDLDISYLAKSEELLICSFDSDIFCDDILYQVAATTHSVNVLTFQIIYLSAKYIICIHLHYRNQPNGQKCETI